MIRLFDIPNHTIDTSDFTNLLHDKVVTEFEERFAEYVGAKYACSVNSATSAIFLIMRRFGYGTVEIPSIIPPVVLNAIINSTDDQETCLDIKFVDDVDWVGDSYTLFEHYSGFKVVDSAQALRPKQFANEANDGDLMVFSFYPTKPVSGCDGGMIVSNDKEKIEALRADTFNGMSNDTNNWERRIISPGWKMYMNSIQASICLKNLKAYNVKRAKLAEIRDAYNGAFGLRNTSDHLYRTHVADNQAFVAKMKEDGIVCGIHYAAMHLHDVYRNYVPCQPRCPQSTVEAKTTISIPFHEKLTKQDVECVIQAVQRLRE